MDSIFENVISKQECLNKEGFSVKEQNKLHIAFGVDKGFVRYMGITITSIILNNKDDFFVFHIFVDNINSDDLLKLKKMNQTYQNIEIHIYYVDIQKFKILPMNSSWNYAMYYRFIAPMVLEDSIKKILYLDADVLCLGNLREIKKFDMKGNIVLAVNDDHLMERLSRKIKMLELKKGRYFNSGVLYIDVEKWKDEDISHKAVDLLVKNMDKYEFWDQDVLNIILEEKVEFIHGRWNFLCSLSANRYKNPDITDPIFVHYITGDKPWKCWTQHHPMAKVYQEYKNKSLWADFSLIEPETAKEKHRMAISCIKRELYIPALKWYLQYFLAKMKRISK